MTGNGDCCQNIQNRVNSSLPKSETYLWEAFPDKNPLPWSKIFINITYWEVLCRRGVVLGISFYFAFKVCLSDLLRLPGVDLVNIKSLRTSFGVTEQALGAVPQSALPNTSNGAVWQRHC